jgi:hypothetical protein
MTCFSESSSWATWTGANNGSPEHFQIGTLSSASLIASCMIATDTVIVVYRYNSTYLAKVGTISGTGITYGVSSTVYSASSSSVSICALDSTRAVVHYGDEDGHMVAKVLTVSGTTITVGVGASIEGAQVCDKANVVKIDTDKCVATYAQSDGTTGSYAVVLSVSVATITVNTKYKFSTIISSKMSACALGTGSVFVAFGASSTDGYVIVLSISTTTITFPTAEIVFMAGNPSQVAVDKLDSTHIILQFVDANDTNRGKNLAASISGTTITLGSVVTFNAVTSTSINGGQIPQGVVAIDASTALMTYASSGTEYAVICTISGITVTNYTAVTLDTDSGSYHAPCLLDADRVFLAYQTAEGATSDGTGIVLKK